MTAWPEVRYRAVPAWVDPETPSDARLSRYQFKAKAHATFNLLRQEASMLAASDLVVEVVGPESMMYRDGTGVRSDRSGQVGHVGVVVHLIGTRFGDLRYAIATFHCHQENATGVPTACLGWLTVHRDSIAVRFAQLVGLIDKADVPRHADPAMYESGAAACAAGLTGVAAPSQQARRSIDRLVRRRAGRR